jgi:Ca2+-binding RTX toxin-like protein
MRRGSCRPGAGRFLTRSASSESVKERGEGDHVRTLVIAAASLLILFAGAANATAATCDGAPATLVGTAGNDYLVGTPGRDVIDGRAGNDTIAGLEGNDAICGRAGNDRLYGGPGQNTLGGGRGSDVIHGGPTVDAVFDGRGADVVFAGKGSDEIYGPGQGRDTYYLGQGDDYADDTLGRDVYHGGDGFESFVLNLYGPDGGDVIFGGRGLDGIEWEGPGAAMVDLSAGTFDGGPGIEILSLRSIEVVLSFGGNDTLIGNSAANVFFGGPGDDHIEGRGGDDDLFGDSGTDYLDGGAGTDACHNGETLLNCEL